MNSEFAIGLVNIKKMNFSYLNRYSHYVLRRFFDFALNDKEWVDDIIHNGTSHINKEHLLIILILSCVHKDSKNIQTLIRSSGTSHALCKWSRETREERHERPLLSQY